MLLLNMDVLDLSYKVKDNQALEAVSMQQFGIQYPVYHVMLMKD